ncbi:hypothetical protein BDK51DRAFT_18584, partial [Blyttiomyces helicus]
VCFLCRKTGHSIRFCPTPGATSLEDAPETTVEGICYKCGSGEHRSAQCRKKVHPDNPYPFAQCFVCNQQGHLAGACPQNDKGLYPQGGGCRFCGSVRHLARDCKPAQQGKHLLIRQRFLALTYSYSSRSPLPIKSSS